MQFVRRACIMEKQKERMHRSNGQIVLSDEIIRWVMRKGGGGGSWKIEELPGLVD